MSRLGTSWLCFTVSLQDHGGFLLLRQEPGQEGRRCRGSGSLRLIPCCWTQPCSPLHRLSRSTPPQRCFLSLSTLRGAAPLSPCSLVSDQKARDAARLLGHAPQGLPAPAPLLAGGEGAGEGLGQGWPSCFPPRATLGFGQGCSGYALSSCGGLGP